MASGMPRNRHRGPPMTLGNMRANGVRSLAVRCPLCRHTAVLAVDAWPDHVPTPSVAPRMVRKDSSRRFCSPPRSQEGRAIGLD
jgi:hypothetical protein